MSITVRDGPATVTLTGDLEAWADAVIREATNGAVDVLRREMEIIAHAAEIQWYGAQGVTRRTGASGHMIVVTTLNLGRGTVRVSVGSADTRKRGGAPLPNVVHRPGGKKAKNAKKGDGKTLMPIFVNTPARLAVAGAVQRVSVEMARRAAGVHGG